MRKYFRQVVCTFLPLIICLTASGLTKGVDEYLLKAVFLERFTRFIDYGTAPSENQGDFIIAVYGHNPFEQKLEQVYASQTILNRKVRIVYAQSADAIGNPDILYIGKDRLGELEEVFSQISDSRTLTISDSPGFSGKGVMINLLVANEKIQFEIDVEAAAKKNIRFDRILLMNAIIVKHDRNDEGIQ
jgi:hypothetical protein